MFLGASKGCVEGFGDKISDTFNEKVFLSGEDEVGKPVLEPLDTNVHAQPFAKKSI